MIIQEETTLLCIFYALHTPYHSLSFRKEPFCFRSHSSLLYAKHLLWMLNLFSQGSFSCQVMAQNHNLVYLTEGLKGCDRLDIFEVPVNCRDTCKDDVAWRPILMDSKSHLWISHILAYKELVMFCMKYVGHISTWRILHKSLHWH